MPLSLIKVPFNQSNNHTDKQIKYLTIKSYHKSEDIILIDNWTILNTKTQKHNECSEIYDLWNLLHNCILIESIKILLSTNHKGVNVQQVHSARTWQSLWRKVQLYRMFIPLSKYTCIPAIGMGSTWTTTDWGWKC